MSWPFLWVPLFLLCIFAGWLLTLFAFPGNWVVAGATLLFVTLSAPGVVPAISWGTVGVMIGLAVLGEILEFLASASGLSAGGTKRGAVLALVGSLLGSAFGAGLGIPIPILGSAIGALFFGAVGAMVGAVLGEMWSGKRLPESVRLGRLAFWARLLGAAAKVACGTVMVGTLVGTLIGSWF